MRSALTLMVVGFVLFSCRGSETPAGPTLDPACRSAEAISPGTRLAAATDDSSPRFAVKVRGPGELAIAGFLQKHSVRIIDIGTTEVASQATTTVCTPNYVPLPTAEGEYAEYCVILEPLAQRGYSTFDLDFTSQPHERVPPDQAAKLCGGH